MVSFLFCLNWKLLIRAAAGEKKRVTDCESEKKGECAMSKRKLKRCRHDLIGVMILFFLMCFSSIVCADTNSPVIDSTKTGSLTLYKLKENDGVVIDSKGNPVASPHGTGMAGIQFKVLKIAEIQTVVGDNKIGTYLYNLDSGFKQLCVDNHVTINQVTIGGNNYYTTETLVEALYDVCCRTTGTPGEVNVNTYVNDHQNSIELDVTDSDGKTEITELPLGLYLVAETDYSGYTASADKLSDGVYASEFITNPSSPFLVALPMSNQNSSQSEYWQYDVTAYPKNQTAVIPKYLVDESDGKSLVQTGDYEIGEIVHEVIAPSAPSVTRLISDDAENRDYEEYIIMDEMEDGLSFHQLTAVKLGSRVLSPESTDAFSGFQTLQPNTDYRILKGTEGNELLTSTNMLGVKAFRIQLVTSGLRKLNNLNGNGQVVVFFDAVVTKDAKDGTAEKNQNKPSLIWKHWNTAEGKVSGNQPSVYTYHLDITKEGVTNKSSVSFSVKRKTSESTTALRFVSENNGKYHLFDNDLDEEANAVAALVPSSTGKIEIRGLDSGEYEFTEQSTQNGYELLKSTFLVTLTGNNPVDGNLASATLSADGKSTNLTVTKGSAAITVQNYKSFVLRTGGSGNHLLIISAAVLLLLALWVMRRRRKNQMG